MRHPAEGVLRRLLDEPAGVADSDRHHVLECPQCLGGLATAQEAGAPVRRAGRLRAALRSPAVAVLAVAVVLGGGGTAAANDWLPIFQTEQVAPVSFDAADLVSLPDLGAYGEVTVEGDGDVHRVSDAATAARQTRLTVPKVADLPRGVSGEPVIQVGGEAKATFTFSKERAERAAAEAGTTLPALPQGLDGSQVRLVAGPGVAQIWASSAGAPALVVGRAVAPTAFSSGVAFETVRDYLLSVSGLPEDVAAQLRTFTGDGTTMPLPVPAERVTTSTADVGGTTATVLTSRDGTMAGVVWVKDGVATVVAGTLDAEEVLAIARGLR
ncbi:hypothetical protein ACIBH1_25280 [Nonomuraea sp. NPDC050663]|uniref:hypothetical protein n=1 Tax=Nonomuraea sp. NPDC050663 TaxID=3364370 RepID=UPI00378C8C84